jgi:aspartate kinase
MISQGSSQHNISFVVSENDSIRSVKILHNEFELEKIKGDIS